MVSQKNADLPISAGCIICVVIFGSAMVRDAAAGDARVVLAQHDPRVESAKLPETFPQDESLEAKMAPLSPEGQGRRSNWIAGTGR
jgi:hypothetical protein